MLTRSVVSVLNAQHWLPVRGSWPAIAVDGRGHHDGDGEYRIHIWPSEFGAKYYVGGEARFTGFRGLGATVNMIFRLPSEAPSSGDRIRFSVPANPGIAMGRLVYVTVLQVRAKAACAICMPAWRCRLV